MDHVLNFFDEVDYSLGIVVADVPSAEEALFIEMLEGEGALYRFPFDFVWLITHSSVVFSQITGETLRWFDADLTLLICGAKDAA